MSLRTFLSICALALLPAAPALAQSKSPAKMGRKNTPPPAAEATAEGPQVTFSSVHVDGPFIAMTFDDGPHGSLTPKLLDLLAQRHIKATFFLVGQNAEEYPDILKRAIREGHELANHSWSHPNLAKMSDEAVRRELQKTDDAISSATGVRPRMMRPPYGSITSRQKQWISQEFGYKIILWDVDPLDWKRPGPATVCNRILKETRPGSIILSHDIHPGTVEAMPSTFEQLQEKGFKFLTVSELLAIAQPAPPKAVPEGTRHAAPDAVPSQTPAATAPAATPVPIDSPR